MYMLRMPLAFTVSSLMPDDGEAAVLAATAAAGLPTLPCCSHAIYRICSDSVDLNQPDRFAQQVTVIRHNMARMEPPVGFV